ncbi:Hsp20/alpha crystallin family protein [Halalkalibacter hemicellulosilyticus]|uniref:Heat shock protein class I n=1 Tax=Halalkalibacter hemicellulosilyticusJCM 9152 TaxID=1236971 RepID=W4QG82_9BACI|nr:Hsp20/alpha crystallin family protein [Halalkalibacter hemicellulosilyticus]GAE30907.1 heat shock protein class I [Halalkalibacter hemicellulosilyticusJCM 9152]
MSENHPWFQKLPQGYQDFLQSIDDFFQQTYSSLPDHSLFQPTFPVYISEENQQWRADVELPGVKKSQIKLDIYNQSIRIQVIEQEQTVINDEQAGRTEQYAAKSVRERILYVPFTFHEKDVKASYTNGLLTIQIPHNRKQITIE